MWKLFSGIIAGSVLRYQIHAETVAGLEKPELPVPMTDNPEIPQLDFVIIGGGTAGSRLAYQLDSLFNVTLVDEKNFHELSVDLVPVVARPWSKDHEKECRRSMALHRYYLKRANVVTGTVNAITSDHVVLKDGRSIPYDFVAVTTGEKKPFPFGTNQRTMPARIEELHEVNQILATKKNIAIVGGGPVGVSLAAELAEARPDARIHLFHSHSTLLPNFPMQVRQYAQKSISEKENVKLHLEARVTDVIPVGISPPSVWSQFVKRVTRASDDYDQIPSSYTIQFDNIERKVVPPRSVFYQWYFGLSTLQNQVTTESITHKSTLEGIDYVFSLCGNTPHEPIGGIMSPHVTADGHYRTSLLNQTFGHANVFVIGRAASFPFPRALYFSELQARRVFRNVHGTMFQQGISWTATDGLQLQRLIIPRVALRLGANDAVGTSATWGAVLSGVGAQKDFEADRQALMGDFLNPTFYKPLRSAPALERIQKWLLTAKTDVNAFNY